MNSCLRGLMRWSASALLLLVLATGLWAQDMSPGYYDAGAPAYVDLWVNPVSGRDSNSGATRGAALQTVEAAWAKIPAQTALTKAYRILLTPGNYSESAMPSGNWFELRQGSFAHPVVIQAADGKHTVRLHAYLQFDHCSYLYLINLDFVTDRGYGGGGNVVHYSFCDHMLLRGCVLNGFDGAIRQPQETLKVNQVRYMYVEDCDISNAFWMGLDYVAVQYGHIVNNKIHDTDNDCLMVKGGSAYLRIEGNEVYNSAQCGLVAGQGTTFGFMVAPWLHYEVYDTKFVNNIVHDIQNAGIAARGVYNVLFAHNTLYRIGLDQVYGSGLILCSPGGRVCEGDLDICQRLHLAGGWGQTSIGDEAQCIPNRNVYIYNNIFYNPLGVRTLYGHFVIFGPQPAPPGTNIPGPVLSDDNLRIKGNIVWNGPSDLDLGLDDSSGAQPSNPTCNETLMRAQNAINTLQPQLVDPAHGNFRPLLGGSVFRAVSYPVPDFAGGDRQPRPLAPAGNLSNAVTRDISGRGRAGLCPPGAYAAVPGDFDGDGRPDLALENPATHAAGVWRLNGAVKYGDALFSAPLPADFHIAAIGDFNGDGQTDLVLENSATHAIRLWFMNRITRASEAIAPSLSAGWRIAGAADLNGDGRQDLILENAGTRQAGVWYMNGAVRIGGTVVSTPLPTGFRIAGAGDFNRDGRPDLLLENAQTHLATIWTMNGVTKTGETPVSPALPTGSSIAGVCDWDGDGCPDLTIFNPSTMTGAIWRMNGALRLTETPISPALAAGWRIAGAP
ncbi:hypothetical protein CCAX7_57800 [Capsulimonas corticalis]|uniref:Right handed beta helix domain-containing protein n=1 Tax=Capsulimonas corticalis TaxID=2219043 RepID=A0A402D0A1_9BACT|nr:FG-GAP-like repeat-containing protein [Capsulimonas corticalis]BDI33729.1 hypothetical protein CCAX7_57800 [Capsulimonas corticalis]